MLALSLFREISQRSIPTACIGCLPFCLTSFILILPMRGKGQAMDTIFLLEDDQTLGRGIVMALKRPGAPSPWRAAYGKAGQCWAGNASIY